MVWIGKHNPQSTSYCFDPSPHFQYFEDWKHRPAYEKDKAELADLQDKMAKVAAQLAKLKD